MMDAATEAGIHTVVLMTSAQIGKTEIINNVLGYFLTHDPCPILAMHPTVEMARTWSQDRLAPMIRDTPSLKGLFEDTRFGELSNTILHKKFPGGHLTAVGANSPVGLASRPIRILLPDEVDRFPREVGEEGDPLSLAAKRTTTFYNRLTYMASTPTTKGESRIEAAFEESDQRYFLLPCPKCGDFFRLAWGQIKWPKGKPETAFLVCEHCEAEIDHMQKMGMIRQGVWEPQSTSDGIAGFHISELYSPWVTWGEMAVNFLEAKKDVSRLRVFVNTSFGETFEEDADSVDSGSLMARKENYHEPPDGVGFLTAGIDTQDDRLEVEVVGWGRDFESWSIDYSVFRGDPGRPEIWNLLTAYIAQDFGGHSIRAAAIDSGGHYTDEVYGFARRTAGVFAVKGVGGWDKKTISSVSKTKKYSVPLHSVAVDVVKKDLQNRLKITEPGAGYCHFPAHYDAEFFQQITAEVLKTKKIRGFSMPYWEKIRPRNEALDCRVYATAAIAIIGGDPNLIIDSMKQQPVRAPDEAKRSDWLNRGSRRRGKWMN